MILVTGATGNVGQPLVTVLAQAGAAVRAIVHSPDRAAALEAEGVDVVVGDLSDPTTYEPALDGIDHAFLLVRATPSQVEQESAFVRSAARAGVAHVVKLSALGTAPDSPVRLGAGQAVIEQRLGESGLGWTILRPNGFMQNTLAYAGSLAAAGEFYSPQGDGAVAMIDARDVADVAARVLLDPGHEGAVYELTGPEALTNDAVAEHIAAAMGRPARHVDVPEDAARAGMVDAGVPAWNADGVIELIAFYRAGDAAAVSPAVPELLGRPARSYADFAHEHAAAPRGE